MPTPHDGYAQVNGIRLCYREWPGEKGPIICLPGLSGHKGTFDRLAEAISPTYRMIAVDLRGRGDSDKPPDGYGFAYHARDILALADQLELSKFVILGHSYGATVGVYLASIRPARLQAAVLIDGGADPKEEMLEAMRPSLRRLGSVHASMDEYLASMRSIPYYKPWNATLEQYLRDDVMTLADGHVGHKASAEAVERDLDIHFYYSMCVHFPTLQCLTVFIRPELGLRGDRAHVLDPDEAAAFVAWIPHGRQVDIPNVNHYTLILSDEPPIIDPILSFLEPILAQPVRREEG
jgi:pimeloyl-ACP methyl ester carboxylesterase